MASQGHQRTTRRSRLRVTAALAAASILSLSAASAMAIDGGVFDGDAHPQTAFLDVEFEGAFCTAVLISPTQLLTAAHCVGDLARNGVTQVSVTFESTATPSSVFHLASTWTVHPTWNSAANDGPIDVAVITLDAPVSIQPAQLAPVGALDQVVRAKGLSRAAFVVVGYGQAGKEVGGGLAPGPLYDFTRRQATQWFHPGGSQQGFGLTSTTIRLTGHASGASNPPGGTSCAGDSGAPVFLAGSTTIVAIHSEGRRTGSHAGNCAAHGDLAARVDTADVQTWLASLAP